MADEKTAPIQETDYTAIEAAVMETQRGRWFLTEYARRNRNADTDQVLGAIDRLDNSIRFATPEKLAVVDDMVASLIDMADAINQTKREVIELSSDGNSDHFGDASSELDAVVAATESATDRILSSAETIQECAFAVMERGEAKEEFSTIDAAVMEIYEGCSFQDITGQRISKVVHTLRYLEGRIDAMATAWTQAKGENIPPPIAEPDLSAKPFGEDPLLNGPAKPGEEIKQNDVDNLLDGDGFAAIEPDGGCIDSIEFDTIADDAADAAPEMPNTAGADIDQSTDDLVAPQGPASESVSPPETASVPETAADLVPDLVPDSASTNVVDMPVGEQADLSDAPLEDANHRDPEWRGQNIPAMAATPTAIASQATLEALPKMSAIEIDALYS
jgi:chemotaxis protein CheZ